MKKVAGTAYVKIDGDQLTIAGEITASLDMTERETMMGLNGPVGFKETGRAPFVELEAFFGADFPYDAIKKSTELTVTVEFANGRTGVLSDATLIGTIDATASEGKTTLRFEGMFGEWL